MARYDAAFFDELHELGALVASRHFWFPALLSVIPTALLFWFDHGLLFLLYFLAVCLWTRSARLGGLIGWFIVAQTVFMYYSFPVAEHFIGILLRAPARSGGTIPSAEQVLANIPASFSSQLFFSLIFGIRAGVIGLGLGFLGRKIWCSHPDTQH